MFLHITPSSFIADEKQLRNKYGAPGRDEPVRRVFFHPLQQISPSLSFGSFVSNFILCCASVFTFLHSIPNVKISAMNEAASAKTNTSLSATAYASCTARRVCGRAASACRFEAPAFITSVGETEDVRREISVRRLDSRRA